MVAQSARPRSQRSLISDQRAALPAGAQIFAGIKTETRHGPERADDFAAIRRPMRLGRIFNQCQVIFKADFQERIQLNRMPKKMDR